MVLEHHENIRQEHLRQEAVVAREKKEREGRARIAEEARQQRLSSVQEPNARAQKTWLAKARRKQQMVQQQRREGRASERLTHSTAPSITFLREDKPQRAQGHVATLSRPVSDSPPPLAIRRSNVMDKATSSQGGVEAVGSVRVVLIGDGPLRDATTSARRPEAEEVEAAWGTDSSPVPEEFQDWVREPSPVESTNSDGYEEGYTSATEVAGEGGRASGGRPCKQGVAIGHQVTLATSGHRIVPVGLQLTLPAIARPQLSNQRTFKHFDNGGCLRAGRQAADAVSSQCRKMLPFRAALGRDKFRTCMGLWMRVLRESSQCLSLLADPRRQHLRVHAKVAQPPGPVKPPPRLQTF